MTMPWFVWAYGKVMAFHHYADRIVAPYKQAAAALLLAGAPEGGGIGEPDAGPSPDRGALRGGAQARRQRPSSRPDGPLNSGWPRVESAVGGLSASFVMCSKTENVLVCSP